MKTEGGDEDYSTAKQ